ncbi:unnamed protein product [Chondrus crispus]|uniref:glycerol kinase n=1 Tax=Chondrus crispus TaxID=2769 RepID=R7QC51_CHOCR|nr:unnamed protein product [Chondrus crispus]CDF34976.1 unnamed protein product [Chondrus crispus]|eukprot:XP_005714795.1 unnamed protein product [Chondrus crispus]
MVILCAYGSSGQMQDLIAVGPSPPALLRTEAVLYSDARAQAAAASLSAQLGERVDATGILPKLTLLPPPTQQAMASYKLLLGAADYVVHKFCKEKPTVTDATTVSTTGLTRGAHREYDSEMLRLAGLGHFETLLPDILARPQVVGRVSKLVAEELGRGEMEGIPVVHAGGDAFSATVGAGREGRGGGLYVYCGSSGWVGGSVERKGLKEVEDGVFRLGHAGDERLEVRVGSVGAAGVNVSFAGATLLGGVDAGEVCRLARGAAVGAGGLSYVPYLEGRRCPRPSVGMRGGLVGMTGGVGREEVARAVVEGVVFALAEAGGGGAGRGVRMVGGGVECEVLVRGIAALVGGGEVEVGSEAKGVGIVGAGRTAKEVVDGEAGEEWWSTEKVVRVGEEEMGRWVEAFAQWRRSVQVMEGLL